jgi:hypothetical protein
MMDTPLSLILALAASAVLVQDPALAAKPGNAVPKAAAPAGPMGVVSLKGLVPQQAMLYVQKAGGTLKPKSFAKNGTLQLPVGDYTVVCMSYRVDGIQVAVNYGQKPSKMTVAKDKPVELEPVTAAAMKVTAGKANAKGEISLSLTVITADDAKIVCQNAKDAKANPGFRVLDAAGKEVAKGSFEFG